MEFGIEWTQNKRSIFVAKEVINAGIFKSMSKFSEKKVINITANTFNE